VEAYTPPEMPPFPKTTEELFIELAPYHQRQETLELFSEFYVVDVIGMLPAETSAVIANFFANHAPNFVPANGDWRSGVKNSLNFSETIDIAILDLWYRNTDISLRDGWTLHPWHFAKLFLNNYFADNSTVDVWPGDALHQAKERIRLRHST
jgi:hypothetical protein